MPQNEINSIVTTTSGILGGLFKALSPHITITAITFQSTCEVVFYAAISALVGYGVKIGIDKAKKLFKRKGK
jgi:hypothetical protein